MAKKSMIAREVKRIKTVAKFADKRVSLKAIMNDEKATSEERYEASVKLPDIFLQLLKGLSFLEVSVT